MPPPLYSGSGPWSIQPSLPSSSSSSSSSVSYSVSSIIDSSNNINTNQHQPLHLLHKRAGPDGGSTDGIWIALAVFAIAAAVLTGVGSVRACRIANQKHKEEIQLRVTQAELMKRTPQQILDEYEAGVFERLRNLAQGPLPSSSQSSSSSPTSPTLVAVATGRSDDNSTAALTEPAATLSSTTNPDTTATLTVPTAARPDPLTPTAQQSSSSASAAIATAASAGVTSSRHSRQNSEILNTPIIAPLRPLRAQPLAGSRPHEELPSYGQSRRVGISVIGFGSEEVARLDSDGFADESATLSTAFSTSTTAPSGAVGTIATLEDVPAPDYHANASTDIAATGALTVVITGANTDTMVPVPGEGDQVPEYQQ